MARIAPAIVLVPFLAAALSPCGITPAHLELEMSGHSHAHAGAEQPDAGHSKPAGDQEDSKTCGTGLTLAKEDKPNAEPKAPPNRSLGDAVTIAVHPFVPVEGFEAISRFDNPATAPPGRPIYALTQRLRI